MVECVKTERWLLFSSHAAMLRAYIRRFARDLDEAEDVFQEVSLMVWRHATGPRELTKFAAWCRGLVRNAVFEQRRKERGRQRHITLDFEDNEGPSDHEELLGLDSDVEGLIDCRKLLGRYLHKTPQATQVLLVRRYVLEETAADIASELGHSAVAVRMKLKRARAGFIAAAER
jgi:RNA polymerase sigma-70 factor, ECF subfamily